MPLTTTERNEVVKAFRDFVHGARNETAHWNVADLRAAVESIDDTLDLQASALTNNQTVTQNINARLPEPVKTQAGPRRRSGFCSPQPVYGGAECSSGANADADERPLPERQFGSRGRRAADDGLLLLSDDGRRAPKCDEDWDTRRISTTRIKCRWPWLPAATRCARSRSRVADRHSPTPTARHSTPGTTQPPCLRRTTAGQPTVMAWREPRTPRIETSGRVNRTQVGVVNATGFFDGRLSDIAIWNAALTAAEIGRWRAGRIRCSCGAGISSPSGRCGVTVPPGRRTGPRRAIV